jgi:hypothetical protein
MSLSISPISIVHEFLVVIRIDSTPLSTIVCVTVNMCVSVVSAHPETLTLPAFSAPGVDAAINKLCVSRIRRRFGHPRWVIFTSGTLWKRMLPAIVMMIIIIMMFVVHTAIEARKLTHVSHKVAKKVFRFLLLLLQLKFQSHDLWMLRLFPVAGMLKDLHFVIDHFQKLMRSEARELGF